jgi:DNA-binding MarR family transcriptional regulator
MNEPITQEEMGQFHSVWHELIAEIQKANTVFMKGGLQELSTVEISVLAITSRKPDVILKEILRILEIPASTLTSAVDRLEKRGLLRRVISVRDRRSYGLELTDDGLRAQDEHRKAEEIVLRGVLGAYTPEERSELVRLLRILAGSISGMGKEEKQDEE